ncbi:MAG: four helix bundle protein [Sedimentisphaerales bacterium]|nr:four helix bundle protein [Sedimentisphaerales bacterium]
MQNQSSKLKTDLKQRAYKYSIAVIEFLDALPKDYSCQIIAQQLLRSATSVGANIVEAKGASSKRDFTNFFSYSLKSANESLYWLGLLRDAKKIKNTQLECLLKETKELANILGSSILTLKGKKQL